MNIVQIESNLQRLMKCFNKERFIYELLLSYGLPKASITRLQKGNLNLSKNEGEIIWKKKLYFKEEYHDDLHITVSEIAKNIKHSERFVIVTDYQVLLAIDTRTDGKLDIEVKELPRHYDFFLPWAGMEKAQHASENPADVKAAERMANLFDEIKKDNPDDSPEFIHGLNVFLSRLLFCFFAEDTKIFRKGQFTNAIGSHSQKDGSDLHSYLNKLFEVLNTAEKNRRNLPAYLSEFPYVNGGLFEQRIDTPNFTRRSRQAILDSGELDWSAINPDIFGSMIQAVITHEHRGGLGMHYTSVPNIMKVIEPLFLNDLYEAFEKAKGNPKKLNEFLHRLSKLKIFDPACGSGNFLIIAYKELRRLEIKILQHLQELQKLASGFLRKSEQLALIDMPKSQFELAASFQVELFSRIQLNQFFGIELDDFAHEIAQLSLWLAEHQMNVEFKKEFGQTNPTLPLKEAGKIMHGNACRIDWETVCTKKIDAEIYILGNPPYLGYSRQSDEQKLDMAQIFGSTLDYKKLDYITCWLYKGAQYIRDTNHQLAFVTTNSVCQGIQVSLLWPLLFRERIEIGFAHLPFKWENSAKANAGVYVIVIGLRNEKSVSKKLIFSNDRKQIVGNINPYLANSPNVLVYDRKSRLSKLPQMVSGLKAGDDGNLILSESEQQTLISKYPAAKHYIKKYIGANDFMNGIKRYCIWVHDNEYENARLIPPFIDRFEKLKKFRSSSKKAATRKKAKTPYAFDETNLTEADSILIPQTGSERREYLPVGFMNSNTVISNGARVIYNAEFWSFGLLSSKMHIIWIKAVAGRLKMDMQYSNTLCYNTFPFPPISDQRKAEITQCVFRILEEREKHPEKTLAQLYDPNLMPEGLRDAHHANDQVIEKCYRARPFESDEVRLEFLYKLYEKMIEEEKNKGSFFEALKKTKKKKR